MAASASDGYRDEGPTPVASLTGCFCLLIAVSKLRTEHICVHLASTLPLGCISNPELLLQVDQSHTGRSHKNVKETGK